MLSSAPYFWKTAGTTALWMLWAGWIWLLANWLCLDAEFWVPAGKQDYCWVSWGHRFGHIKTGSVRPDKTSSTTRAEMVVVFLCPCKDVDPVMEQDFPASSGGSGSGSELHATWLLTAELKTLTCTVWIHMEVHFGRAFLWELGQSCGTTPGYSWLIKESWSLGRYVCAEISITLTLRIWYKL